jgi:hypothetical protein
VKKLRAHVSLDGSGGGGGGGGRGAAALREVAAFAALMAAGGSPHVVRYYGSWVEDRCVL